MSWLTGLPAASASRAEARERGFTLLEVLVAFAILAVAMTAILQAFGGGLDAARRTEAADGALAAARSLLDRVGTELPVVPGVTSGESGTGLQWSVEIARRKSALDNIPKPERPSYALFEVRVSVSAPGAAPVSLETLRLAPDS